MNQESRIKNIHNSLFIIHYSGKSRGFTLLEALIYVAIIALLTVVVVNTAMVMTVTSAKARLKQNILGEGGVSLERLVREIRLADSVDVLGSTLGAHPGVLKMNTIVGASDETPITREFYLTGSTLVMKEGSADAVPFTENINITVLCFIILIPPQHQRLLR